jgi:hypothetical protein
MKKEEIKEILAKDLTDYINLKKNQDECSGFIEGYEKAFEHLQQETPKEKCDGCKRAEGSDSIYTCSCNVETQP